MLYELSLAQVAQYDQRHAAMVDVLDFAVAAYKDEVNQAGEIRAAYNLAEVSHLLLKRGRDSEVVDLFVEAIARLAER